MLTSALIVSLPYSTLYWFLWIVCVLVWRTFCTARVDVFWCVREMKTGVRQMLIYYGVREHLFILIMQKLSSEKVHTSSPAKHCTQKMEWGTNNLQKHPWNWFVIADQPLHQSIGSGNSGHTTASAYSRNREWHNGIHSCCNLDDKTCGDVWYSWYCTIFLHFKLSSQSRQLTICQRWKFT